MWERSELKQRAKETLSGTYFQAFFVALVLGLVTGGFNAGASAGSAVVEDSAAGGFVLPSVDSADIWTTILLPALPFIIGGALVLSIASFLLKLLLWSPIEVGCRRYFLEATQRRYNMGEMGYAFGGGRYGKILGTMILRDIFTVLWTLLLVIPGFVKMYAYRMVPYILAENPGLGASRSIQLSQEMTRGHKWNMFVLDLSFVWWYLLGGLACGVGIFFVSPYIFSTDAQLYLVLREQALANGLTTMEELSPPPQ